MVTRRSRCNITLKCVEDFCLGVKMGEDDIAREVVKRLVCLFKGHQRVPVRAINYNETGGTRHYSDGTTESIPSCTLIERCDRCGKEWRVLTFPRLVERRMDVYDIEVEW